MSKVLFKSTLSIAFITLFSRIFGFVRDLVTAQLFGAGLDFDAFIIAFRIPNCLRHLLIEGGFSQAFVPVFSEYQMKASQEETTLFVSYLLGDIAVVLLGVTLICVLLAPLFVFIFAPGFIKDLMRFHLSVHMLRILFFYMPLVSLVALFGCILNGFNRFKVPAFSPIFLNLFLIGGAFWGVYYWSEPVKALAWSVLMAGVIQFIFHLPFLKRLGMLVRWRLNFRDPGVRRVLFLMLGSVFAVSIGQIGMLVDTLFASFLKIGSVSWLYYSERLVNFPLGIFGVSVSTVIMPKLSRNHALASHEEFFQTLDWAVRFVLLVGMPAAVGLCWLSVPLFFTLFRYGKFTVVDGHMAATALQAFSLGLPAFMLRKVLTAGFYSKQDVKIPLKIASMTLALNVVLNAILIFPLAHVGLALATSLSSWFNVGLLIYHFRVKGAYKWSAEWAIFLRNLLLAIFAMGLWLKFATPDLNQWLIWGWFNRAVHLLGLILMAVFIYFGCLRVLGVRMKDSFAETCA